MIIIRGIGYNKHTKIDIQGFLLYRETSFLAKSSCYGLLFVIFFDFNPPGFCGIIFPHIKYEYQFFRFEQTYL